MPTKDQAGNVNGRSTRDELIDGLSDEPSQIYLGDDEGPLTSSKGEVVRRPRRLEIDFRRDQELPSWVREKMAEGFALEAEDARKNGHIGFMARSLVIATMPYKNPKADAFTRKNGDFTLRMVAGHEAGLPFGIYPRLLTAWVTTEAVRTREREIELGATLSVFLREAIGTKSRGGGKYGIATRVADQMKRLFGSLITAVHDDKKDPDKSFALRNILIADELDLLETEADALWLPQSSENAGKWRSRVLLNQAFFNEIIDRPVPVDRRACRALRSSPLALDLYQWLTYRMSYQNGLSKPISYEYLLGQFGSNFTGKFAIYNFRKNFVQALDMVLRVYPEANVRLTEKGLQLRASPTHVPMLSKKKEAKKPDEKAPDNMVQGELI